jgi:hypothetical protein
MRRQTPIAHLLYSYLFPHPTANDPVSFSAHLARNLVPEVRIEVATFYGDLNTVEARYPGLNYCHPPHRMRLGRFKHHKRLFEAFDTLGLTYNEIQEFCCWEGTKWARERYEKDENVKVVDTTGDEIGPYVDRREQRAAEERRRRSITRKTDISVIVEEASSAPHGNRSIVEAEDEEMSDPDSEREEDGDEDEETPTEAAARQEHITEITSRRDQSILQRWQAALLAGQRLPPDIEQELKEASEREGGPNVADLLYRRAPSTYTLPAIRTSSTDGVVAPRAAA